MSKVLVEESSLHGVGNGIRYVNGKSTTYKPAQFEAAIKSLKPVMGTKRITENGTFPASGDNLDGFSEVTVAVPPSSATLIEKSVTENGEYDAADDDADGYSAVTVEVPNTYEAGDEGKVVSEGELVAQTSKIITVNGTHDTTTNDEVVVAVPNTYGAGDEGKVVSSGALVSQTSRTADENGTYDTTLNNQVVVDVPNSYAAGDEGKVVSNGELVSQGSLTVTENDTYDTTLKNSVTVNVSGSAPAVLETLNVTENGTFTPGTGVDGFDEVNVNVVGSSDGTLPGALWLIAYGSGVFVAIGDGSTGAVSAYGSGWYETELPSGVTWTGLAYGGGKFVAFGQTGGQASRVVLAYSSDGITWETSQSSFSGESVDVVYGNGKFVAFLSGGTNKALLSANGTTWTEITLPVTWSGPLYGKAVYGNGKFVAIGSLTSDNSVVTLVSTDGETWTDSAGPSDLRMMRMAAGGGKFVAMPYIVGGSNAGYYSSDGLNWTQTTLPITASWNDVGYGNGNFLAVSDDEISTALVSADGVTWREKPFEAGYWDNVAYGGGAFVAVDGPNEKSARFGLNLPALTVTQNGTYTPQSGVDGFSSVVVNVSGGNSIGYVTSACSYAFAFETSAVSVS